MGNAHHAEVLEVSNIKRHWPEAAGESSPGPPAVKSAATGQGNSESRRFLALAAVVIVIVSALALAYRPNLDVPGTVADHHLVTDMYGRTVRVPGEINHLVAIGAQALRLVSYLGCGDMIVATESRESPNFNAKSYMYANPRYAGMNVLANSALTDMETILALDPRPDLVIMGEATSSWQTQLDLLEAAGIPVVGILNVQRFGDLCDEQMRLLGRVLGREERAGELLAYIGATIDDLSTRVAGI